MFPGTPCSSQILFSRYLNNEKLNLHLNNYYLLFVFEELEVYTPDIFATICRPRIFKIGMIQPKNQGLTTQVVKI